jgi:hypothetical protein
MSAQEDEFAAQLRSAAAPSLTTTLFVAFLLYVVVIRAAAAAAAAAACGATGQDRMARMVLLDVAERQRT